MNEVIKTLTNHRSIRQYKDTTISNTDLNAILSAAQSAPSWVHGQQVSVIVVKDQGKKKDLSLLCGDQKHIEQAPVFLVFCADFHRAKIASDMENLPFEAVHDVDALLVGATDVGIALSNAIAAAESLGLGTVPIGGIRRNPLAVIQLLELPKFVIPIVGLCVGYPDVDPGLNPRLPKEAFVHYETYNSQQESIVKKYNDQYAQHQSNGRTNHTWTERISNFYKGSHYNNQYPDVPEMLKQQGFSCKDIK